MKQTVLVIENDAKFRDNISEILVLSNYTVHCASNGKEGLEMVRNNTPDIILCDVMMPELDGYGVLRGLKNNPATRNIPFIYVTGRSKKENFRAGMNLGADDYLIKPFNSTDLLSIVDVRLKKAEELKKVLKIDLSNEDNRIGNVMAVKDIFKMTDKLVFKKLKKKDILFSEGDTAKYLHFVVSGKIKLFKTNNQGKEYITQVLRVNDFFGYSSLLDRSTYEETAMALEDSEIGCILKQDFQQLLSQNNTLNEQFIRLITFYFSKANNKLINMAYNSARKRVAEAILYLGNKYYKELADNIEFPVCRDDISAISGVSPESVSRNLTEMKAERLIQQQPGSIKIINILKLSAIKN